MKFLLALALVLSGAVNAVAAEPAKPLIVKSSGGGHVHPEYGGMESCALYPGGRMVITHQFGFTGPTAVKVVETKKVNIQGDFATLVALAAKEDVTERPNNMCDGPHTGISANDQKGNEVLLFSTGGCGTSSKSRDGLASTKLKNIVDLYCPNTFGGGIEG